MEKLIVVFTERRNIGITAIPYFAVFSAEKPIKLLEHATLHHLKTDPNRFSEDEKNIIETLHKISDHYIYKKYSKEGTLKDFFDKLHKDARFKPLIKIHIEQYVYQTVRLLAKSNIQAYHKNTLHNIIYQSDLLKIEPTPAIPICYFNLAENELLYSLKIRQFTEHYSNKKKIDKNSEQKKYDLSLLGSDINFILMEPAVFIISNRLYYFDKIDGNKFKPFIEKSAISILKRQIPAYMEKFVVNCIRNYQVEAQGFEIVDADMTPKTVIKIIKDLSQQFVIALHFKYDNCTFLADSDSKIFVILESKENNYRFIKITRNLSFEKQITDLLESLGLAKKGDALFITSDFDKSVSENFALSYLIDWINNNLEELNRQNISIVPQYDTTTFFIGKHNILIDTKNKIDWFEINATINIGEFNIPFIRFRKNLIENEPSFILPDGKVFMIPNEWFVRFSELFDYAKIDGNKIILPHTHFELLGKIKHHKQNIGKDIKFPIVKLPDGLKAKMRPYQIEGYKWLNFIYENNFGGILADDMGLGKTVQAISLLLKIYHPVIEKTVAEITSTQQSLFSQQDFSELNSESIPASLICMPTTLLFNWKDEFRKFAPTLKIYTYSGENRLRSKEIGKIFRHYNVIITSYGILRNDIELLINYKFHYFILDESQYVKNPSSKIYDAVMQISANRYLMLTGTPVENSLMDLWAQMDIVNRGLLGTQTFFKKNYVVPITQNNNEEKTLKLQKMIRPFFMRRTKDKVAADLPPIMEQTLYCEMTTEQRKFYEHEKSGIRNNILKIFESKTPKETTIMALQALTRLRQIANHPVLIDNNFEGASGKFEQIIENLENVVAERHNVLVFSSFVKDLELLKKELENRNLNYEMLVGKTKNRKQVVDRFFKETECRIFLISLKTGGVGLNLTKADYVFMLNPWWNPAAEEQAINRAHRIGQTKNVFVYRFLSTDTIEEKIARLQQSKKLLANNFVGNNNPLKELTKEEILELFG